MNIEKKKNRFEECNSLEEGKVLYRAEMFKAHPDQGGSSEMVIALKREFDSWITRKVWESRQSDGSFRPSTGFGGFGGPRRGSGRTDVEDTLSTKTKEKLREVIESGLNCDIEIVGSFIWLSGVPASEVLTMISWDFTFSKKYGGKWFWADFEYMKQNGLMPRGRFNGSYEDMKSLWLNKQVKEKLYLSKEDDA